MTSINHNLPVPVSSFIGREHEIASVTRWLASSRLVTLTGAGGSGKTRLALEVARGLLAAFPDGISFTDLAPLSDAALVPWAAASALGIGEQPGRALLDTLTDALRDKELLLLLDNCEHLIEACAQLAESLLQACPHLRILATSREALAIPGEQTVQVPTLSLPPIQVKPGAALASATSLHELLQYEAIRLFVDRAAAADPAFALIESNGPAVVEICRRLDGIPLAIELAAARARGLTANQIAGHLDDRFRLLTAGNRTALPRHQTLRALIDWSYDLLSPPEQVLLRRLSVFAGGWMLEAAQAVCADEVQSDAAADLPAADDRTPAVLLPAKDVLDNVLHLVDKSLVLREPAGPESRFRMLETIRQYAHEKLVASGESERMRDRHLKYFADLSEASEPKLYQSLPIQQFEAELDNLRAAMEWSLTGGGFSQGLGLAAGLWFFLLQRGGTVEWRERLMVLLARPEAAGRTLVRARALHALGTMAYAQYDYAAARTSVEEALAISRELDDAWTITACLDRLGRVLEAQGDYHTARAILGESLALRRTLGNKEQIARSLIWLGDLAVLEGDFERAQALYEESVELLRELEDRYAVGFLANTRMIHLARLRGDTQRAVALNRSDNEVLSNTGTVRNISGRLVALAAVAAAEEQNVRAAKSLGAIAALLQSMHTLLAPFDMKQYDSTLSAVRAKLGDQTFERLFAEGQALTHDEALALALAEEDVAAQPSGARKPSNLNALTPREREVLRLLAAGLTDAQIAERLVISRRTVNTHLNSIYGKLGVNSRSAATRFALEHKLV